MSLLAPAFLLGLLAVGLPWWLHRLSSDNPNKQKFSSLMFLEPGEPRRVLAKKVQYLLLLALRIGPLLVTPWAIGNRFEWLSIKSKMDLVTGWVQFDDSPLPNWKRARGWQVMIGGGSAMNLAVSFACAMISVFASDVTYVLLRQTVWLNLIVAVVNVIPFVWARFEFESDGKKLMTLLMDEGGGDQRRQYRRRHGVQRRLQPRRDLLHLGDEDIAADARQEGRDRGGDDQVDEIEVLRIHRHASFSTTRGAGVRSLCGRQAASTIPASAPMLTCQGEPTKCMPATEASAETVTIGRNRSRLRPEQGLAGHPA